MQKHVRTTGRSNQLEQVGPPLSGDWVCVEHRSSVRLPVCSVQQVTYQENCDASSTSHTPSTYSLSSPSPRLLANWAEQAPAPRGTSQLESSRIPAVRPHARG